MKLKTIIEKTLFSSKWLLLPFYLGLMVALVVYAGINVGDIYEMIHNADTSTKETSMLTILELVDIAMVASLVKMIITGGYHSYISKEHGYEDEKSSSGLLKIKMATSLVGVSSIHLLQTFINAGTINWDIVNKQIWIHATFLVGALILALIELIYTKTTSH